MKGIDQCDQALVVQPSGVFFLYERIVWLLSHEGGVIPVSAMD
jgi:hypothetical protein